MKGEDESDLAGLVLAVGTGLGTALIHKVKGLEHYNVLPIEGGHTTMTIQGEGLRSFKDQSTLFSWLSKKLYDLGCVDPQYSLIPGMSIDILLSMKTL